MEITLEQHVENWKGLYNQAIIKMNEYKKSFAQKEIDLVNKNRELSMRIMSVEKELEKYKVFFGEVQSAHQTLIKKP